MAAAACGAQSHRTAEPPPPQQTRTRRRADSRRRQAALFFLTNISLDGRPNGPPRAPPPPSPPRVLPALLLPPQDNDVFHSPTEGPAWGLNGFPEGPCPTPPGPPPLASKNGTPHTGGLLHPGGLNLELQRQRSKHLSGSPRHKGLKKVHFIKNMRQYDTRSSRIVLICAKRSLCAAFSILPYGESTRIIESKVEGQKRRHSSGGTSAGPEMVLGLEGVELGADGKVVSYARFLHPTNALVCLKGEHFSAPTLNRGSTVDPSKRSFSTPRFNAASPGVELGSDVGEAAEYNPNLLDDPQWPFGKHKRVLIFASYMTTVIEYVKPSELKKNMNETFKEKFPHIKLTLSKIRSLKREMRNVADDCGLEPVTVAMSYVYFEKLVLQGKLNKQNRKLCAGACVLLAAKISSDLKKPEVSQLFDKLEERFRFNKRDLIEFEFTVLVGLEMALYLPENQVLPHYRRLTQQP
ncbi:CDK5 and ABL1 enzyme substrate 2 isoform X2 [Ambystoma mexicanum]|uniref:CDK5 and ABL1 enzyme substrate 2 isoform X2 n=1 Tax=Ambystoma mexicanum TaxID=8296 RepID=UPI0037E7AA5A